MTGAPMPRLRVALIIAILVSLAWLWRLTGRPAPLVVNAPPRARHPADYATPAWEARTAASLVPPAGFRLSVFAAPMPRARFLCPTPTGDLLVSSPEQGCIFLLAADADGDGRADGRQVVIDGLHLPHGLDLHAGFLYVAETDAISRIPFDPATRSTTGPLHRIVTGLPGRGGHWTRTVRIGPDGRMYVSIGSSCNNDWESDPRRATIMRFEADGSGGTVHATGLRNAVGFAWRAADGQLYATDNGRDLLGDDFPPCELNRIVAGGFYGWPVAHGDRVPDPALAAGHERLIAESLPPVHAFRAHNAPLGICFLQSPRCPAGWRDVALVCLHGSWNRSRKDGYQVVSLHWQPDGTIDERPFLTGFLRPDESVIGRPVDVAEGTDGAIYVSDDYAEAVYRLDIEPGSGGEPHEERRVPTASPPPALVASPPGLSMPVPTTAPPVVVIAPRLSESARTDAEALWRTHACAQCHDAWVATLTAFVPLRDLTRNYDPDRLAAFLQAPRPPMPAAPLTDPERRNLSLLLLERYP